MDTRTNTEVRRLPDGQYGMRKRVDGSRVLVAMDPQPTAVIEVHQLCNRLKRGPNYQRRITYTSMSRCYIAEYIGKFPETVEAHGNSVHTTSEYVRTRPEVMVSIKKTVTDSASIPSKIYQRMKNHATTDEQCPRNKKQVNATMTITFNITIIEFEVRQFDFYVNRRHSSSSFCDK